MRPLRARREPNSPVLFWPAGLSLEELIRADFALEKPERGRLSAQYLYGDFSDFMIRVGLQISGLFILASAFATLAIDAWRSFAAKRLIVTEIGATAATLAPGKMDLLRTAIEPHSNPALDWTLTTVAHAPTFAGLGVLGALAFWLARKPPPKIGYSSR